MDIRTFSVENGLKARSARAVFQSSDGFIWGVNLSGFTSDANLDRLDGKDIKHFDIKINQPDWHEPVLLRIYEDFNENFWIYRAFNANVFKSDLDERERNSVFYAIHVFDTKLDSTIPLSQYLGYPLPFRDNATSALMTTEKDGMLVGTTKGAIYELNQAGYTFKFQAENNAAIAQIIPVEDGYWIALNDRFIKLDKSWSEVDSFLSTTAITIAVDKGGRYDSIRQPSISSAQDEQGNLHHIAFDSTLWTNTEIPRRQHYVNGIPQRISDDLDFFAISPDTRILFALKRAEGNGQSILAIDNSGNILAEQPSNIGFVDESFFDKDQNLWLATNNGLVLIKFKKILFKNYLNELTTFLGHPFQTRGMAQTADSILWVGGLGKFRRLNLNTGESHKYDELTLNRDVQLVDESIWISEEYSNVFQLNPETNELKIFDYSNKEKATGQEPHQHWKFHKDKWGNLWAGSLKGLTLIDTNSTVLNPLANTEAMQTLEGADVIDIYENDKGLWLGTSKGIYLFDPETQAILKHYHTEGDVEYRIPHNDIAHIYEDSKGVFWLASRGGGLIKWHPDNGEFVQFTEEDGLSSNVIYAVYEDHAQNLWLPSFYGINQFHKVTHNTSYYLKADGLTHDEFNTISHFRASDSTLYFGGLNGINAFHPKDFSASLSSELAPLVITDLSKQDRTSGILNNAYDAFEQNNQLILNHSDVGFNLSFRLLDYSLSKEALYAYRIEGLDADWNYQSVSNVRLNRLPYGDYEFQLKASPGNGVWTEPIIFPLVIVRPFYLSAWFVILCAIFTIVLIYLFFYLRNRRLLKNQKVLKQEVAIRTKEIEEQAQELKRLDSAKSRFFTNFTHELRTPLSLILNPLDDMIRENINLEGSTNSNHLSLMKRNAEHLRELINQLLDISKLNAGEFKLRFEKASIVEHTQQHVARFLHVFERKNIRFSIECHQPVDPIYIDVSAWEHICTNLLANALKFTSQGGSILLTVFDDDTHVYVQVKDTGIGIPASELPHIFDMYYQGNSSITKAGGTGIGLALVKAFILQMGGTVEVKSKPNLGTIFTIRLQKGYEHINTDTIVEKSLTLNGSNGHASLKPSAQVNLPQEKPIQQSDCKVLLVEDNEDFRTYLYSVIHEHYMIEVAENGKEGLAKVRSFAPDIIVSDIMMPEMDGYQMVKAIREQDEYETIPCIFLSAKDSAIDIEKGLNAGADVYLSKPVENKVLLTQIKALLRREAHLREDLLTPAFTTMSVFKRSVYEVVQRHLGNPDLNVEFIAEALVMSSPTLYRKWKQENDGTINQLITKLRLEEAISLVNKEGLTFSEAAYSVGFSDYSYFSKTFKKVYGSAPSEYVRVQIEA